MSSTETGASTSASVTGGKLERLITRSDMAANSCEPDYIAPDYIAAVKGPLVHGRSRRGKDVLQAASALQKEEATKNRLNCRLAEVPGPSWVVVG